MTTSDWTACRAGGLVWGFRLEPRPPIIDSVKRASWQREVIRRMVAKRHLIVVHEAMLSSCPDLIQWAREEHAQLHPTWPPIKVLTSINLWGVWDREASQYEYWPFQMKIREACHHNGWFLVIDGDVARFKAPWGNMVLFDVRKRDFRDFFADLAIETFRPRTSGLDGGGDPNAPDYFFFDEINRTGTAIGQTGKHLPEGWSEGMTILARRLTGGMFNGSLGDTPMMLGRMIQNAQWQNMLTIAEWITPNWRPQRDYLLDFMGDPRDLVFCETAAAVAAYFNAHWSVHEGYFADVVETSNGSLYDGSLGMGAEHHVEGPWRPPTALEPTFRLFRHGWVAIDDARKDLTAASGSVHAIAINAAEEVSS